MLYSVRPSDHTSEERSRPGRHSLTRKTWSTMLMIIIMIVVVIAINIPTMITMFITNGTIVETLPAMLPGHAVVFEDVVFDNHRFSLILYL